MSTISDTRPPRPAADGLAVEAPASARSARRSSSGRSPARCASSTRASTVAQPRHVHRRGRRRAHHGDRDRRAVPRRARRLRRHRGARSASRWGIAVWLWLTVLFANLAESVAEGRGKAQADTLRKTRTSTIGAPRRRATTQATDAAAERAAITEVSSADLRLGDVVVVTAGELIPGDGDIVWGIATGRRVGDHRRVRPGRARVAAATAARSPAAPGCSPTASSCASPRSPARRSSTA